MSDSIKPSIKRPSRPSTDKHEAVQHMRAKFESFDEHQMADLIALRERTERLSNKVPPRDSSASTPPAVVVVVPPDSKVPDSKPTEEEEK